MIHMTCTQKERGILDYAERDMDMYSLINERERAETSVNAVNDYSLLLSHHTDRSRRSRSLSLVHAR
jgi:hypothetical protein